MPAFVQKPAPSFVCPALVKGDFKDVALSDFVGQYLVLFFYPMDFTFVCPTEILAFGDRVGEFQDIGAEVVCASVDSVYTHLAWWNTRREDGGIERVPIPILSDVTRRLSREYGVLVEDGADEGLALRGLFIIDPAGILRHTTINDMPIGRSVDEALRVIQALRFHAERGDVCPADWHPGKPGIKEEPRASKAFFKSHAGHAGKKAH